MCTCSVSTVIDVVRTLWPCDHNNSWRCTLLWWEREACNDNDRGSNKLSYLVTTALASPASNVMCTCVAAGKLGLLHWHAIEELQCLNHQILLIYLHHAYNYGLVSPRVIETKHIWMKYCVLSRLSINIKCCVKWISPISKFITYVNE